jgi:serine/threonine-protein kinase
MMGTPAYMAPEQVMGRDVDARADLYAIGVVFYRLLSAQLPFDADTAIAMVQKQISEAPTPISTFRPDLPDWCAKVIDRALAKSPADRFQSAEEFRTALLLADRAQAPGEQPTLPATPTPPGLLIDPEITLPYDPALAGKSSVVAVPTPLTQVRTAVGPQPAQPTALAAPALERTTGTTVVLGRTHLVAIAALVVVLAVGVAILGFVALRRGTFAQQLPLLGTLPQAAAPTAAASEGAPVGAAADPAGTAASQASPAAPTPGVAATAGAGPRQPPAPPVAARTVAPGDGAEAADSRPARAAKDAPAAASVVSFDDVRVLVSESGSKGRMRDAVLQLGGGKLTVLESENGPAIASLRNRDLVGAFYSRSRQPRWKDGEGREVQSKVDLGRLGFLRGERNWLIVLTPNEPLILRIADADVKAVLPAFTEHTGVEVRR